MRAVTDQMELSLLQRLKNGRIEDVAQDREVLQEMQKLSNWTMCSYLAEAQIRNRSAMGRGEKAVEAAPASRRPGAGNG